jgi:phosphinothricin acetyltransferase
MKVDLARPSDLADILRMIRALSAFHDETATVTLEQLQIAFFGNAPSSTALIAREGANVVGYAGVNHTITLHSGVPRYDIHHLYVAETHRGRGVRKALITRAKEIGEQNGAKGLTIGTDPKNSSAQAAYRAMGLKEISDTGPRFWIPLS